MSRSEMCRRERVGVLVLYVRVHTVTDLGAAWQKLRVIKHIVAKVQETQKAEFH